MRFVLTVIGVIQIDNKIYRNLYCGNVGRIRCSRQCDECVVRFKCFTLAAYYPLVITREEYIIIIEKLRVSGEVGES